MVGPMTPQDPLKGIKPLESGAPKAVGPRIGGMNAPKLKPMGGMGAMKPLPQMKAPALAMQAPAYLEPRPADAISSAFDEPPAVEHKSFQGWVKNWAKDIQQFAEGIPAMIKVAWKAGSELTKDLRWVDELYKHPEHLTKELEDLWTNVVKGMTDTYKDGIGEALYKHPFTVLLDATTAADVLGAAVKTGGKMALRVAGKEAVELGAKGTSAGAKMLRLGDSIQRLPGTIMKAPFKGAGNLAMKVPFVQTIAQKLALTPLGMAEKNRFGTHMLEARARAFERAKPVLDINLSKAERDEFWKVIDGDLPPDMALSPRVKQRSELWHKANMEDENFMKEWGFKNEDELADAVVKPLAERMKRDGRFTGELHRIDEKGKVVYTREALDAAKKWASGENPYGRPTRPSYHKYIHERTLDLAELLESMKSEGQSLQYVSRFEKKTGMGPGIIDDPDVVQARSILQMEELRGMVNYITEAVGKHGVPLQGAIAPKGYKVFNPILLKYINGGLISGYELLTKNAIQYLKGAAPGRAGEAFLKAIGKTQDDLMKSNVWAEAKAAADNPAAWNLAIPDEVAFIIESQLKGVSGPMRFYDKVLNTWRSTVLTLMPRYYVNNILGNSVLLMFGGVKPFTKSMARTKGLLPGEAMSSGTMALEAGRANSYLANLPGTKPIWRVADTLSDITDTRPRQVLVNSKLEEIIRSDKAMGDTSAGALMAKGGMDEAVSAAFAARKELLELGGKQALAAKRVVLDKLQTSKISELDKRMADLQKRLDVERGLSNQSAPGTLKKQAVLDLEEQMEKLGRERMAISREYPFPLNAGQDIRRLEEMRVREASLAPVAAKVERAVTEMERFLGNYGRLHPLERDYIRRVIPFWTFAKTMNMLVFQLPFVAPKTAFLWNQYAKIMVDAANDERLPSRFRNMIPIGGTEDGQIIFMRIGGFNPFEAVGTERMGDTTIPKLIDPAQNPFVKMLIESRGGYDTFLEKPFTKPTDFVSLNGTVWRYDPEQRTLQPTVPQKGILKSLMDQIPHVAIVQDALDSISGARGFANRTPKNPDGTYRYDRSMLWALAKAMGQPISVQNPERVKLQHHLLLKGIQSRFMSAARRSDPETRAQLMHILNDLGSGEFELKE